jgi:hypothetical protein
MKCPLMFPNGVRRGCASAFASCGHDGALALSSNVVISRCEQMQQCSPYSITSSAWTSRVGGTSRPSVILGLSCALHALSLVQLPQE